MTVFEIRNSSGSWLESIVIAVGDEGWKGADAGISTGISRVERAMGMMEESIICNVVSVWYGIGINEVGYGNL